MKVRMPKNNSGKGGKEPEVGSTKTVDGKEYRYLGKGNWEGVFKANPGYSPPKMKPDTNYKSTGSRKGVATPKRFKKKGGM